MTGALSIGERLRRNRHFPRLCSSCGAPMSCQQDTCWRCEAAWVAELVEPPHTPLALRVIDGGAAPVPEPVSTAERLERLRAEART